MAQISLKDWYTQTELNSNANALGASLIGIEDSGGYYTGTEVEAALQEIGAGTTLDGRYILDAGDNLNGAPADGNDTLNRWYYNRQSETVQDNAVISVGGTYDGSLATLSYPVDTISVQIYGQATNDGSASVYAGIAGMADATRDASEIYGLAGIAFGAGTSGFLGAGGTSSQNISNVGVLDGYGDNCLQLQHRSVGVGIRLRCYQAGAGGIGVRIQQDGTSDMQQNYDGATLKSGFNDEGNLYFSNTAETKIFLDGDAGGVSIGLTGSDTMDLIASSEITMTAITVDIDATTIEINAPITCEADGLRISSLRSWWAFRYADGVADYTGLQFNTATSQFEFQYLSTNQFDINVGTGDCTARGDLIAGIDVSATGDVIAGDDVYVGGAAGAQLSNNGTILAPGGHILLATANQIQFRDTGTYIYSSTANTLVIDGDTQVEIRTPTATLNASTIEFGTDATADTTLNFLGGTFDGQIIWMEDEDYFQFNDDILMNGTERIYFTDTGASIYATASTGLRLAGTTLTMAISSVILMSCNAIQIGTNVGDSSLTFRGGTFDGRITWMEDENYFKFDDDIMIADGENIILDTTTGTKIGTAANQKLAFYGATPIVQQAGVAVTAAGIHAALVNLGLITV